MTTNNTMSSSVETISTPFLGISEESIYLAADLQNITDLLDAKPIEPHNNRASLTKSYGNTRGILILLFI